MSRNKRRADATGDALLAISSVKKHQEEPTKSEALPKLPRPQSLNARLQFRRSIFQGNRRFRKKMLQKPE